MRTDELVVHGLTIIMNSGQPATSAGVSPSSIGVNGDITNIIPPLYSPDYVNGIDGQSNFTVDIVPDFQMTLGTVTIGTILGLLILTTLIGNTFVIFAILTDRNLKRVGNYLILSLAVADFLVALTVMPIGAIYEVTEEWRLGPVWCELWTSADVLCCTASILHLVAIALDRYWTVTHIDYIHKRSGKCVIKMLICVWSLATTVSIAPQFGWKDDNFDIRVEHEKMCLVSQDVGYQVFATCLTFYAPLIALLLLYWRVFKVSLLTTLEHRETYVSQATNPKKKMFS